jgi:hypothetical protein
MNGITFQDAKKNQDDNPNLWLKLKKDYEDDPRKYQKWSLPSSWYYMNSTDLYVDVPMHLLFLGIGKSVFIKISKWLKMKMQLTEFKSLSVGILDQLKLYNIQWRKVLQYPYSSTDKFGGWVAENFLAFIRISQWFYTLLYQLKETKETLDLETPHTAWRMKEHKFWLELRGLSTEGNAKTLKERVHSYMDEDIQPPIIITNKVGVAEILELVTTLNQMVSMILSLETDYDEIGYIEIIIRKFLIDFDKVDAGMGKKEQPSWLTQYNFLCLLNIPNVMRKYGYIRNIWEGNIEGEGFLRKYKKELRNGLKPMWQIYSVRNLLQRGVFIKENIDTFKPWKERLLFECRIYQSQTVVKNMVLSNKPLSCVIDDKHKQLYILFREKKIIYGIKINVNWNIFNLLNECKYYEIIFVDEIIKMNLTLGYTVIGCLLLPRLSNIKINNKTYCIVYSDWRQNY